MPAPNIVLVTLDTMRADRLGKPCRGRTLTPNLSAFAERGRIFPKAVAAGVPTYFSFPPIFLGGRALDGGKVIGIRPGCVSFVEELKQAGYRTAAVIASNPYLSRYYHFDAGFDVFEGLYSSRSTSRRSREERASLRLLRRAIGKRAVTRLQTMKARLNSARECLGEGNPALHYESRAERVTAMGLEIAREFESEGSFFLWLHYMDIHGYFYSTWEDRRFVLGASSPFAEATLRWNRYRYVERWTRQIIESQNLPGDEPLRHTRADARYPLGFYDASVMYADRCLSPLIDYVDRSGDTLLLVTSDHGEQFFEHGRIGHAPFALHDEIVRVPLIVGGAGVSSDVVSDWVSHSSIRPTILDVAGIEGDGAGSAGAPSLVGGGPFGGRVLTETLYRMHAPFPRRRFEEESLLLSCREGDLKYVWCEEDGSEGFFDTAGDPGETTDVTGDPAYSEGVRSLREAVQRRAAEIGVLDARAKLIEATRRIASSMGIGQHERPSRSQPLSG